MIRTLLTTSALALVLSTGAIAQDAAAPADPAAPAETTAPADSAAPADAMAPAGDAMAPADEATEPADDAMEPAGDAMAPAEPATDAMAPADTTMDATAPFDMSAGYVATDDDQLVSRIMGASIFSSGAEDAETIGTVNDLVLGNDGRIHAVVIGVGGFLGIGEKNVAVDFASLEHTVAFDQTERWVLATTAEALTAAPDFVWPEDENMAADPAMAPADPATEPAPVTQ